MRLPSAPDPEFGEEIVAVRIAQICTGSRKTVEYLEKALGDAVEQYRLDWLKWDNSGPPGPVCTRADHGHQVTDGALAALQGQYETWDYLHRQFPKLILEECGCPGLRRSAVAPHPQGRTLQRWTDLVPGCAAGEMRCAGNGSSKQLGLVQNRVQNTWKSW